MNWLFKTVQDGISSVQPFTALTSDVGLAHGGHFLDIFLKLKYENLL